MTIATSQSKIRYAIVNQFIATLFACDMTRVAAFHMNSQGMDWLSSNGTPLSADERGDVHNNIAHMMKSDDDTSIRKVALIHAFYAAQVSALCDLLKSIDDGDGKTVYDNTIILWTNELGDPVNHLPYNVPFVLAGGGGDVQEGPLFELRQREQQSAQRSLGLGAQPVRHEPSTFGDSAFTGELKGL